MAVNVIYTKVLELLKRAGIDPQKFIGKVDPNKIKKLTTKTETTATKPKLIDALTKDKKTFSDALDIFENEAKYLSQFNEMELTNFANNLQDYFTVGGKVKYTPSNVVTTEGTPVLGKQLEKISARKGAKGEADTTSLEGAMGGLMSLVDELKGISPKMRNQMDRDELAAFIQKMRGKKFTNEEIKWVKTEMDKWGIGSAKEKATGMQYGKKLGAKSEEEFEFVNEYVDNVNSYSPKEFKEMYGNVKNVNMDISRIIDDKLEKHFKKKYNWDKSKGVDGGLDDITYEKYEDELYEAQKEFGDFHTVYDSQATNMWGQRKGTSCANHPNNYLDEASEKFESITGQGLNVDFFKKYTDDVLTKYVEPEKFQYGGPVIKGPDMGATAHGSGELLARSRMLQPGGQTTTSTGLNYLLGEDDQQRIPFAGGGADRMKTHEEKEFEAYNQMRDVREREMFLKRRREEMEQDKKRQEEKKYGIAVADGGRIPFQDGLSTNKIDLGEILQGVLPEREPPQLRELMVGGPGRRLAAPSTGLKRVLEIQESIKADKGEQNKVLGVLSYILENGEQELSENLIKDIGIAKIKTLTTMSGYKQDLFEKTGVMPIDGETIYNLVINDNILGKYNLDVYAIADAIGTKEIEASLKNNNMGLSWNSETGQMEGSWTFNKQEGPANQETKWSFTPSVSKNDITNSEEISLTFDRAVNNGDIQFSASEKANSGGDNRTLKFNWTGEAEKDEEGRDIKGTAETIDITHLTKDSGNELKFDGVKSFDFYNIDGEKPTFSLQTTHNLDKGDENYLATAKLPLPFDTFAYGEKGSDSESAYGIGLQKDYELDNWFTKEKGGDNKGIFSINADANLATGDKDVMFNFRMPFSSNKLDKRSMNFNDNSIQPSQIENHVWINGELVFMPENQQFEYKMSQDDNTIRSGNTLEEGWDILNYAQDYGKQRRIPPLNMADGGIARLGFAGGKLVDMSRRGFLKFVGGTAASIAALKTGLVKLMGGKNADEVKKVIDEVVIAKEAGAPDWFQPLVNKILREGKDANLTYGERQIGKVMDTPSGKVDIVYKMDTGDVELSFVGKNTALGEQVDLVYKPGQVIEEGKFAGKKEGDEFIASETVPESHMSGPDDWSIDAGAFETGNVGELASDLSELKTFATGEKATIKEIAEGIKKKKTRETMEKDPGQYLVDKYGDYDPYASGGLAGLIGE